MKEFILNVGDKIGYFKVFRNTNQEDIFIAEIEIIRTTKTLAFSKYCKFKRLQNKNEFIENLNRGYEHLYAYKLIK